MREMEGAGGLSVCVRTGHGTLSVDTSEGADSDGATSEGAAALGC